MTFKGYDETDRELVAGFFKQRTRFRGAPRTSTNLRNHAITFGRGWRAVVTRMSMLEVLYRAPGFYILNMDHGSSAAREDAIREFIVKIAEEMNVALIPVSERAYRKVAGPTRMPKLVHRSGYECVFRLGFKYYLSGYDQQENPPLYFLCRLPKRCKTVAEAREALMPPSVRTAVEAGVEVRRQGDLFFIKHSNGPGHELPLPGGQIRDGAAIYGTNHYARKSCTLDNRVMLVHGMIYHKPPDRTADHKMIDLKGWWIAARNTVPATPTTQGREGVKK